jgi:hypothetical protein
VDVAKHQIAHGAIGLTVATIAEAELFSGAGFTELAHERVVDPSPSPEIYTGRWFRDAAQLRAFKAEGALLVHGEKS